MFSKLRTNLKRRLCFSILTSSLIFPRIQALAETKTGLSSQEYGKIYVIEERNKSIPLWRAGLFGGYEAGNPYSHIYGISQTIERSFGRFFRVGIKATEFLTSPSRLTSTLENELSSYQYRIRPETPLVSASAIATVIPLSGHLNFFGNNPLNTELGFRLGIGAISYKDTSPRFLTSWSLIPVVHLNEKFAIQGGFGHDFESLFNSNDRTSRLRGELGVVFNF